MAPDLTVTAASPGQVAEIAAARDTVDVVVSQPAPTGRPEAFEGRRRRLVVLPRIVFNGFHPDSGFLLVGGRHVRSPTGEFHSRLAIWAFLRGYDPAATVRLFTESTFDRLGYFARWGEAERELLAEGRATGLALDDLLPRWRARGCFMYGVVQPRLFVLADLARRVLAALDRTPAVADVEPFLLDSLKAETVWSVYPPVARRLGVDGGYAFKAPGRGRPRLYDLVGFVEASFEIYRRLEPERMDVPGLDLAAYDRRLETPPPAPPAPARAAVPGVKPDHPYRGLPSSRFWRRAVAGLPASAVDPVDPPPFTLSAGDRVATAGSCFAQHLAGGLAAAGLDHFVVEPAADGGFPPYAARYGHLYTARQLLQLFERAHERFTPVEPPWPRPDGALDDPFRQSLAHRGWASGAALDADRTRHLAAVRRLFAELDVFIFTLGLTEAWTARADGAVFPLAPGVLAGRLDHERHAFVNFTTADVVADLEAFLAGLESVNPRAKVILTVSPVPLAATYEARHVLVASTYSKAVLRAAADEVARRHDHVAYFPAYELVAGPQAAGQSFAADLRDVTPATVARVVALFRSHFVTGTTAGPAPPKADPAFDFLCEENALDPGAPTG
jgi:hypothetical protein